MENIISVGAGTHYENAKAWITAQQGDSIKMPNGQLFTLKKKNTKSALCVDSAGGDVNIPIKKLLPFGSDAYVPQVVRDLQDRLDAPNLNNDSSFFATDVVPVYDCPDTLSLARRIIRACNCSVNPKADVIDYLDNRLTKSEQKLSVDQQHTAGRIAARHLLGEFPCPMHDDKEYSVAEWKSFDTWFFRHHKTKELIAAAQTFDRLIKKRIGEKLFNTLFGYRRAKSATEMATSLKDCLHSWFIKADARNLDSMNSAYEYLLCRIDHQSERMTFILEHPAMFKTETDPQDLTDLLIDSCAFDLLQTILIWVHDITFGRNVRDPIPQFHDLTNGKTNIQQIKETHQLVKQQEEASEMNLPKKPQKRLLM